MLYGIEEEVGFYVRQVRDLSLANPIRDDTEVFKNLKVPRIMNTSFRSCFRLASELIYEGSYIQLSALS